MIENKRGPILPLVAEGRTKKEAMNVADALLLRDRAVKNAIYRLISTRSDQERDEFKGLVDQAFAEGEKDWENRFLPIVTMGPEEKQALLRRIRDREPQSRKKK